MRFEYSDEAHLASLFPVAQQIVAVVTIFSSLTRAVVHVVQLVFNNIACRSNGNILKEKLSTDWEGIQLGVMRMIPIIGSFISFIILARLDEAEGGALYKRLALKTL